MTHPQGPGAPYQLLFSDEVSSENTLPEPFRLIYPGDWPTPAFTDRPYIYTNFAQSRDGRISFNEPDREAAVFVTKGDPHDRWLMALLRMRSDAALIGDVTINLEKDHIWTSEFIYPPDTAAFAHYRQSHGLSPKPILVLLSFEGKINFEAASFQRPDLHIVLATTDKGVVETQGVQCKARLDIHNLGAKAVDLHVLAKLLYRDYGIRNLLCEGGARVFANLLDAGLVDEEFVTFCPTFVGRSDQAFRPSYCEGVAWLPESAPYSKPISLHRAGDLLFMRTRCIYDNKP